MGNKALERWIFFVLLGVGLLGLAIKVCWPAQVAQSHFGFLVGTCGDFMFTIGGIGTAGILCAAIFGTAEIRRINFWVFLIIVTCAAGGFLSCS
jgi:hypothetical protein